MDYRQAKRKLKDLRPIFKDTIDIHSFIDSNNNSVKIEFYKHNGTSYIHIREMKKTNIEQPTNNYIVFSLNYLPEFLDKLKEVRYKRNPNWRETFHVYHKEKDFVIEIEKNDDGILSIRKLEGHKDCVYRPTKNEIVLNNTRERVKGIINSLEKMTA